MELLVYLVRRYPHSSEREWRERIEQGRVRLDGDRASPETVLRHGRVLTWRRPPWVEPEAPASFAVLHEDAHLLAVGKPAGLPTVPGAGFLENTLLRLVESSYAGAVPVHRLGRWTSGLVLFARSVRARQALSAAWREGAVRKVYRALAVGAPREERFTMTYPIGEVNHRLLGTVFAASPEGKQSRSVARVLERRGETFLAEVTIETGRPHQIRIHLAAAGHPLVGDPLYPAGGVPPSDCTALPGDPGYHLHAESLRLEHPATGERLALSCAPPRLLRCSC
jgi:23S rRNA pseudouridine1911/1915/1917 synthase